MKRLTKSLLWRTLRGVTHCGIVCLGIFWWAIQVPEVFAATEKDAFDVEAVKAQYSVRQYV